MTKYYTVIEDNKMFLCRGSSSLRFTDDFKMIKLFKTLKSANRTLKLAREEDSNSSSVYRIANCVIELTEATLKLKLNLLKDLK